MRKEGQPGIIGRGAERVITVLGKNRESAIPSAKSRAEERYQRGMSYIPRAVDNAVDLSLTVVGKTVAAVPYYGLRMISPRAARRADAALNNNA